MVPGRTPRTCPMIRSRRLDLGCLIAQLDDGQCIVGGHGQARVTLYLPGVLEASPSTRPTLGPVPEADVGLAVLLLNLDLLTVQLGIVGRAE